MVGKDKHTQSICTNPPDLTHFMAALQVIPGMILELNVEKKEKTMKYYNYALYSLYFYFTHSNALQLSCIKVAHGAMKLKLLVANSVLITTTRELQR